MAESEIYVHLQSKGGKLILRDRLDHENDTDATRDWLTALGGEKFLGELATAFYGLVAEDEVLAPLFTDDWPDHARRLAEHFRVMYVDGRLDAAWDRRLLAVHSRFVISHEHRRRWLALFWRAGREIGADEEAFQELVSVMVIAAASLMGVSRGAAMARGVEFDRRGEAG